MNGEPPASPARATQASVAAEAGVSQGLVSRLLNGDPSLRIPEATRARILSAAAGQQYVPNHAGRALRRRRTDTIALLVPELANPVFAPIIAGAERAATERGAVLLLASAAAMEAENNAIGALVAEGRIDGVIFQQHDVASESWLASIQNRQIHGVLLNSTAPGPWSSVILDDRRGSQVGTRALVELGHEDIAIIGGVKSHQSAQRRYAGFRDELRRHRLPVRREWVLWSGLHADEGREGMRRLAEAKRIPSAVFVSNVNAGIGALSQALDLGIRVPQDLSIVALHDAWPAQDVRPSLTTVRTPLEQMGELAVRALLNLTGGGAREDLLATEPAPELVARQSIGPGPVALR